MKRNILLFFYIVLMLLFAGSAAAEVYVKAAVDQQNVYVGEPLTFQIQVEIV